ncbi:oligopeptide transporter 4-like [Gossypium australe]|uniref:Oligopeptide transporter 4-like n=1 Tax=Gossypium australe TaxID=47621 RepID=A0A5B6VWL6_9ROSI|nr:oligopeptide transporter 4-like [Gossypium australe]
MPLLYKLNPSIVRLEIEAPQFELKLMMFQMFQTVGQFSRMLIEDPHIHLQLFKEVSDSFKLAGVIEDALRLKLLSYSLRDRYFPPSKNAKLRKDITTFQHLDDESLYEACERFKKLLRKCIHHGIPHCIQLETFYNGLNAHMRTVVDTSANGALISKS